MEYGDQAMTDIDRQSLRNFMAIEVMGWEPFPSIMPEDLGELYKDVWYGLDGEEISRDDWHPDLDSNQLDMLVDKMVEAGWYPAVEYLGPSPDSWRAKFSRFALKNNYYKAFNDDRRLAVLLAIKAAKES